MTFNSGEYFLRHATETATAACEEFFEWVSHFSGDFSQDREVEFGTLFDYFDCWITHKEETLTRAFADGSGNPTWEAFKPLLPFIYIGIIDHLLVNPGRLDYEHNDPILQTSITICRPMRRVVFLGGKEFEQDMDILLNWVRPPEEDETSWFK